MNFTSTPRGARLARRLVSRRLDEWGHPQESPVNDAVTLITAELVANAVRHGHVPGRDFRLRLTETTTPAVIRVEVTDTRTEKRPAPLTPRADCESGRGLLLVSHLAARWAVIDRSGAPGKTVWAEVALRTQESGEHDRDGRDGMRAREKRASQGCESIA